MRLVVLLVLALSVSRVARGAPIAPPCKRCVLALPGKLDGPIPLVVVLHGDRQAASTAASWWQKAVLARGWALLSLQCPTDEKCVDSYWKWDGEPRWVFDQVAAVAGEVAIDPARTYLVGWSGGASWIGDRLQDWDGVFAAIVIHGGGIPPRRESCAHVPPAYFLVGDHNPLHRNMIDLHDAMTACKADTVWDLVKGADHEGEQNALTAKKADVILDWLAAHARS